MRGLDTRMDAVCTKRHVVAFLRLNCRWVAVMFVAYVTFRINIMIVMYAYDDMDSLLQAQWWSLAKQDGSAWVSRMIAPYTAAVPAQSMLLGPLAITGMMWSKQQYRSIMA